MFNQSFFIVPQVYHTGASLDGYAFVTGTAPLVYGAKLLGAEIYNVGADAFVQVHDGYAQPTNGSVPLMSFKVLSGTGKSLDCSPYNCLPVVNGIVIAISSTAATYTSTTANLFLTAFFIV